MNSISRALVPCVAAWAAFHGFGCSSSEGTSNSSDAAVDSNSGNGSGSSGGSGSTGSSGSSDAATGSSGSSGGSGSSGSGDSSRAGDAEGDSGSCATDADCGSGSLCGFPQSAGCSAVGACFPRPGAMCNAIELGCACDGTSVNLICNGLPDGYTPKPFAHTGACGLDSGSPNDGGNLMDGATCVASGDPCGAGLSCCATAGYVDAPKACTPTCAGAGCAGACRALP